jgi:non-ribosomal peptide synthase protein (TIGR01720 family)
VPLTPIQRWFFEQDFAEAHHFNQALLLEVRQAIAPAVLEEAVGHLLTHHDVLRLRFERTAAGWQQVDAAPDGVVPFTVEDLSALPEAEQMAALEAHAASLQASLDLSAGPLLRVAYFDLGPGRPARLVWVIHHLAVDGVSWRILLEDLLVLVRQISRAEKPALPPKTTSFRQWAESLTAYARSDAVRQEVGYWLAEARATAGRLPVDLPGGENLTASTGTVTVMLSAEETQALLHEVPEVYHTQIIDALLTALGQALASWTGRRRVLVDLEGHGREDHLVEADLSRTVGWFTTIYPVLLEVADGADAGAALKAVKEQLRAIPNGGIGYGLLRYLHGDEALAADLRALPQAELMFNYLGQVDRVLPEAAPLARARESSGSAHSRAGRRQHLLDVNGVILGGQLRVNWTYSEHVHRRATVETLAQGFLDALRSLIAHCRSPEAGGYTPSDFPDADLSQEHLDLLLSKLNRPERISRS